MGNSPLGARNLSIWLRWSTATAQYGQFFWVSIALYVFKSIEKLGEDRCIYQKHGPAVYFPAHTYASFILRKAHPMEKVGTKMPVPVSWIFTRGKVDCGPHTSLNVYTAKTTCRFLKKIHLQLNVWSRSSPGPAVSSMSGFNNCLGKGKGKGKAEMTLALLAKAKGKGKVTDRVKIERSASKESLSKRKKSMRIRRKRLPHQRQQRELARRNGRNNRSSMKRPRHQRQRDLARRSLRNRRRPVDGRPRSSQQRMLRAPARRARTRRQRRIVQRSQRQVMIRRSKRMRQIAQARRRRRRQAKRRMVLRRPARKEQMQRTHQRLTRPGKRRSQRKVKQKIHQTARPRPARRKASRTSRMRIKVWRAAEREEQRRPHRRSIRGDNFVYRSIPVNVYVSIFPNQAYLGSNSNTHHFETDISLPNMCTCICIYKPRKGTDRSIDR